MSYTLASVGNIDQIIQELSAAKRIALDTEFHAERRYFPTVYLIQFHIEGGQTWLIDPLVDGFFPALSSHLLAVDWIVHGGRQDLFIMNRLLNGLPEHILDTQIGAGLVDSRYPENFGRLNHTFLNRAVDKGETLSDWSKRPLKAQQLRYAADDVQQLIALWDAIALKLTQHERLDLAAQACREVRDAALEYPDHSEVWRNYGAVQSLGRHEAAIFQELVLWRESRAADKNQPVNSIISTAALIQWSRKKPTHPSQMSNRRISKSFVRRDGEELVELIGRAAKRPEWAWPRFIERQSAEERTLLWLKAYAATLSAHNHWAPALVCPHTQLTLLALNTPKNRQELAQTIGAWRDQLIGEALWNAISGLTSIYLENADTKLSSHPTD